uniref:Ras association domain family member 7a n=1 Tax=Erpetoichthys calabaricus TaxID=27687 RepID=A0A8C4X369_ERPCA
MELKVWVDGVLRVVCGLSEDTSCQDVVIALAQAIGQTGRYILIQKLRDTERQLLANEKPLESLAKCGQYANDVQFILRRTGPSTGERPSSNSDSSGTSVGVPLPAKPAEAPKRKEPKKSMTFNLGSMGSVDFSTKKKIKPAERFVKFCFLICSAYILFKTSYISKVQSTLTVFSCSCRVNISEIEQGQLLRAAPGVGGGDLKE